MSGIDHWLVAHFSGTASVPLGFEVSFLIGASTGALQLEDLR